VDQAARAVEALYFPHAVDPLSRILRESPQPSVRASALRALARIDTAEAAELVLGTLEHGPLSDRGAALSAIKETGAPRIIDLARATLPGATGALQASLREVIGARSMGA
jgi:HEAT repeat protein